MMNFSPPSNDDIRRLAYAIWERRGRPMGSPDEDWFQAEKVLRQAAVLVTDLKRTAHIVSDYLKNYDIIFNARIGPSAPKQELRSLKEACRFCGKSRPEVKFSKVAHAIPEAIGNKALTLQYECDTCNDRFSVFEDDFAKLVLLDRSMSQIKGKAGVPSMKTKAGLSRVDFKPHMLVTDVEGDEIVTVDVAAKTFTIDMPTQNYRPLGVYKALVKIALSLVDDAELPNFSEALEWLRQPDVVTDQIDDGMGYLCWRSFTPGPRPIAEPHVLLFRRKPGVRALYCQLLLAFGNTSFQISIPSPLQDSHLQGEKLSFAPIPIFASLDRESVRGSTQYGRQSLSVAERISTPRSVTYSFEDMTEGI